MCLQDAMKALKWLKRYPMDLDTMRVSTSSEAYAHMYLPGDKGG